MAVGAGDSESAINRVHDPALREVLIRMDTRLETLERRSAPLVIEKKVVSPDGSEEVQVQAKSTGVGKLGAMLAVIAALTPLTLGILQVLGQ